ncbi:ADP-ribosylation factor-binding protein GGA3a [Pseudoliparis swirei]|uniref:ADP-ribosylation factor-binding protein GGA3a n=1 Tax=Pseudoliparis swirei TaxID=2059687 RepID=UPI0024BEE067|nr:ADP-ribosylation factor-binding protein GGA3a [Pseudoliparis swirei]
MAEDGESLESWLNKATNPANRQEDWEYIMGFCDQINKELEGPQISVRLLAHKIQSPQEWEAIQALTVLEACMKNCGQRFHTEVGKFRFLNELIKVVSPKYLGDKVSEGVKTKVIEMLYSWTVSLPDEAKVSEAYEMLKSQAIVLADPDVPLDATIIPSSSPRPKNPVFDDEKTSKRLSELLKSKKPEDLQEANRLIKNMVKEDEVRMYKVKKQKSTLEAVDSSVKLLNEMLAHFNPQDSMDGDKELIRELYGDCEKLRQTVFQLATETEDNESSLGDILQASDDLSHVINSYKKIVEGQIVNGEADGAQQTQLSLRQGRTNQSEVLIDLLGLDIQGVSQPPTTSPSLPSDLLFGSAASDPQSRGPAVPSAAFSLLDEELLFLGLNEPAPSKSAHVNLNNGFPSVQDSSHDLDFFDTTSPSAPAFSSSSLFPDALSLTADPLNPVNSPKTASALSLPGAVFSTPPVSTGSVMFPPSFISALSTAAAPAAPPQSFSVASPAPSAAPVTPPGASYAAALGHNLQDLALLDLGSPTIAPDVMDFGRSLVKSEDLLAPAAPSSRVGVASTSTSISLLLGETQAGSTPPPAKGQADDSPLLHSMHPILPLSQASPGIGQEVSLANVFVPLDAIKPSKVSPVTAYDKNGVRVLLHFATECPAGRPDVLVMVASTLNTASQPVTSFALQAAVPKTMKVRLQAPTGTELGPFNPILPPAAITQVMLLANPLKEKVRMRYRLTFTLGEQLHSEVGEVNEFPSADRWGAL